MRSGKTLPSYGVLEGPISATRHGKTLLWILIENACPAEIEQLFSGENEALNSGLSAFKLTVTHFLSSEKYALKRSPANSNSDET
jgi:hypothetical protein